LEILGNTHLDSAGGSSRETGGPQGKIGKGPKQGSIFRKRRLLRGGKEDEIPSGEKNDRTGNFSRSTHMSGGEKRNSEVKRTPSGGTRGRKGPSNLPMGQGKLPVKKKWGSFLRKRETRAFPRRKKRGVG